jgi:hypothetical protein
LQATLTTLNPADGKREEYYRAVLSEKRPSAERGTGQDPVYIPLLIPPILHPNKMYQTPRLSASLRDLPARSSAAVSSIRIPDRLVGVKERKTPVFSITRDRGFLPREVHEHVSLLPSPSLTLTQ